MDRAFRIVDRQIRLYNSVLVPNARRQPLIRAIDLPRHSPRPSNAVSIRKLAARGGGDDSRLRACARAQRARPVRADRAIPERTVEPYFLVCAATSALPRCLPRPMAPLRSW